MSESHVSERTSFLSSSVYENSIFKVTEETAKSESTLNSSRSMFFIFFFFFLRVSKRKDSLMAEAKDFFSLSSLS